MSVATVEVNLPALLHNIACFKKCAPDSQIAAIVKANAYGHGMVDVAHFLQDHVTCFGVARLSEALILRSRGIIAPIILLEGFFPEDDLALLERYSLQTVIHSPEQIKRLQQFTPHEPITVWFKIDTGMHRLGFAPQDALDYFQQLVNCSSVKKPINIVTHFACADELESLYTAKQIATADNFISSIQDKSLIGLQSFAASGGILAWPTSHRDIIRPGIALYGVSPFSYEHCDRATGKALGLQSVMTLKSELIAVRDHPKGEGVGYGQIWHSPCDTQLGVVAMGYGDGYPRAIPVDTPVIINGKRLPIVGRVAMDMIVVDLGPQTDAQVGDEVIFWGEDLPVEEVAALTGISAYELITRLTSRAKVIYKTASEENSSLVAV